MLSRSLRTLIFCLILASGASGQDQASLQITVNDLRLGQEQSIVTARLGEPSEVAHPFSSNSTIYRYPADELSVLLKGGHVVALWSKRITLIENANESELSEISVREATAMLDRFVPHQTIRISEQEAKLKWTLGATVVECTYQVESSKVHSWLVYSVQY